MSKYDYKTRCQQAAKSRTVTKQPVTGRLYKTQHRQLNDKQYKTQANQLMHSTKHQVSRRPTSQNKSR